MENNSTNAICWIINIEVAPSIFCSIMSKIKVLSASSNIESHHTPRKANEVVDSFRKIRN